MTAIPQAPDRTTTGLRAEAEAQLSQTIGQGMPTRSADALVHELQVHQIELVMQNEVLQQTQSALEVSRDRYLNLYEYAPVAYLTLSADGLIREINLTGVGLLGMAREAVLHQSFERFVELTDTPHWRSWFERVHEQGKGQSIDLALQRADGSSFYAQLQSRILTQGAEPPSIRITLADISEQKKAELALAQYKAHLEALIASRTADLRAKEARIAHFSRLTATLSAINRAITFNTRLDDVFAAACRAFVTLGAYKLAWIGQLDATEEHIEIGPFFGQDSAFLDALKIDSQAGQGPGVIAYRKQQPYICHEFVSDPAPLSWHEQALQQGYVSYISLPIDFDGQPFGVLTACGDSVCSWDKDAERVLEEIAYSLSFAVRHFADEAEKQRNAKALQESEALLQEAQKVAALGHWTYRVADGMVHWSPQVYCLLGLDPAARASNLADLTQAYVPASARRLKQAIARVIERGKRVELELQLKLPDGQLVHHALALIPHCDDDGKTNSLYGTIQNITEHKQTEQKLLRLAEQLVNTANEVADLYEHAPCGYHSLDKEGVFRLINDTELQWLGYSHDELVGQKKITDLLSAASLPDFNAAWPGFLLHGTLHDLEMEFVRKDGTLMPVLLNATAIRDAKGVFQMSRSTVYDMTERHKMELERAEHTRRITTLSHHLVEVQETARRQLSGELHDRTSPNLAAIDINFGLIAQEVAALDSANLGARLEDIRALIKDTSASIHEICINLRPPILDYAGLPSALESYAQQFASRTGIPVHTAYGNQSRRLASDIESLLFRIAQESLTNCAKHAQATAIDLILDNQASPIVLSITDNGAGFVLASLGSTGERCGLGILNMRDMAEFAGGHLSIESEPGRGTRIRVEIP